MVSATHPMKKEKLNKQSKLKDEVGQVKKKSKKKKVTFGIAEISEPVSVVQMISSLRHESDSEAFSEDKQMITDEMNELNDEMEEETVNEKETVDEKEHGKLLKSLGVEETKKKFKEKTLPVEPTDKEIEGTVSIADLISSAGKSEGLGAVQRLLDSNENKEPFKEPLPRHQREQAEREVHYEKSKKDVTKWLPLVKRNRETEHLSFPLYHAQNTNQSREGISSLAVKHKVPQTKLEEEIFEVLATDSHLLERPDHFLTEAEEKTLAELDAEEAELRREELSKMRALLSYQEEKFRRKNKIKSKTYHKILKKERIRKEEKALSDALKADPNVAGDEQEKSDYLRALERISQKHKVGGKWNKNLLHKNIKDPELKAAMSEQRQLRQKLMEKQDVSEEEDDEEEMPDNAEKETVTREATDEEQQNTGEQFEVDPNNPWLAVGNVLSEQTEAASEKAASEKTALENPVDDSSPDKAVEVPNDDVVSEERSDESNSSENKTVTNSGNKETNSPAEQARNDGKKPLKDGPNIDQETLVDMAFANDDVVAQFVEEKEKTLDAETDKDIDVTLPGWGSWAGVGTADKPRQHIIKKAAPALPRKDAGLDHVIINTKKNRKLMQHQVKHLPHPYKNRSVFEREMRQPIGPQWNSVRSFKNMIKPSESVLDGHIIEPMTAPKGFDKVIIRGKRKSAAIKL